MTSLSLGLGLNSVPVLRRRGLPGVLYPLTTSPLTGPFASLLRTGLGTLIDVSGNVAYGPHNLLLHRNDLTNGAWTNSSGITVTLGQLDPWGGTTAQRVVFPGANNYIGRSVTSASVASSAVWVKGIAGQTIGLAANGVGEYHTLSGEWQLIETLNKAYVNGIWSLDTYSWATAFDVLIARPTACVGSVVSSDSLSVDTTTAAVYLPRLTHSAAGVPLGTLIEGQGTNLAPTSSTFADWNAGTCTVTDNAATGPDGVTSAARISITGTDAYIFKFNAAIATGNHTESLYVKASGPSIGKTCRLWFWFAGTATGTGGSATMVMDGSWQRITATAYITGAGTVYVRFDPENTSVSTPGGVVDVDARQLEAGSVATSYIPNPGTGTMVRAGDDFLISGTSEVAAIIGSGSEYTIVVEYYPAEVDRQQMLVAIGTNTNNFVAVGPYVGGSAGTNLWARAAGLDAAYLTGPMSVVNVRNKVAISCKLNQFQLSVNGSTPLSDSSGDMQPAPSMLSLGNGRAAGYGYTFVYNGTMASIRSVPTALTGSALQALSAL